LYRISSFHRYCKSKHHLLLTVIELKPCLFETTATDGVVHRSADDVRAFLPARCRIIAEYTNTHSSIICNHDCLKVVSLLLLLPRSTVLVLLDKAHSNTPAHQSSEDKFQLSPSNISVSVCWRIRDNHNKTNSLYNLDMIQNI